MSSKNKRCVNATRSGSVLASDARVADNFFTRLIGLLLSAPLKTGEGLVIEHCNSIHMIGMKFAIDVVFLDKKGQVVSLLESFPPGKVSRFYKGAQCCIELPPGAIQNSGTQIGDVIEVSSA